MSLVRIRSRPRGMRGGIDLADYTCCCYSAVHHCHLLTRRLDVTRQRHLVDNGALQVAPECRSHSIRFQAVISCLLRCRVKLDLQHLARAAPPTPTSCLLIIIFLLGLAVTLVVTHISPVVGLDAAHVLASRTSRPRLQRYHGLMH
jgi:hypothetical protein